MQHTSAIRHLSPAIFTKSGSWATFHIDSQTHIISLPHLLPPHSMLSLSERPILNHLFGQILEWSLFSSADYLFFYPLFRFCLDPVSFSLAIAEKFLHLSTTIVFLCFTDGSARVVIFLNKSSFAL
ncbi:unnamed protein product [Protopolystoma xenopodis]|uniref:Uncharacterized protein n=1 Tax=Protopolystoma xenopodis TaxID=117903 RepID=A0A3S5BLJ7_9PLAT|nr:unnamed protein product [Protopolystoma xenopodis]